MEQARGDDAHNLVTVVMRQHNKDVRGAMEWIAELHEKLVKQFLDTLKMLPSWGPQIDDQVARYVDGLGNWVRANDSWSFESQRYFGLDGLEIEEGRWVVMTPKASPPKPVPQVQRRMTDSIRGMQTFMVMSTCILVAALAF